MGVREFDQTIKQIRLLIGHVFLQQGEWLHYSVYSSTSDSMTSDPSRKSDLMVGGNTPGWYRALACFLPSDKLVSRRRVWVYLPPQPVLSFHPSYCESQEAEKKFPFETSIPFGRTNRSSNTPISPSPPRAFTYYAFPIVTAPFSPVS